MASNCWACFDEHDEYIHIGTFVSDDDAYIAACEHGVNLDTSFFYVAEVQYVQDRNGIIQIEPKE